MILVALTRFGTESAPADLEAEIAALAPAFGVAAYDLRLTLAAPPPTVLAAVEDPARARELLALLRDRGHGAVACDGTRVVSSDTMLTPRELHFEADAIVVEAPGTEPARVAFADLLLIAEATHVRNEEHTEQYTIKKFSLGRSVLSGGLINTKSTTVSKRQTAEERERVLYLVPRSGRGHVLLREYRLRYSGLGERVGRTVTENYGVLRSLLQERASGARFDDRLTKKRRGGGGIQMSGSTSSQTFTASNQGDTDLAVHLLAVATLHDQL